MLFFLIFKSRSGSTFLSDMLVKHPEIALTPESNLLANLWNWAGEDDQIIETSVQLTDALKAVYTEVKFATWNMDMYELKEHLEQFLPFRVSSLFYEIVKSYSKKNFPTAKNFGLKKGGWYLENIDILFKLYPNARVLHIIRDGRAVYASSKRAIHSETGFLFEVDPIKSAQAWKRVINYTESYRTDQRYLEIRYEDLINATENTIKEILSFLKVDLTFTEKVTLPYRTEYTHTKYFHLHPNVGKAPNPNRIYSWKNELSSTEIEKFEILAKGELIQKGYKLETRSNIYNKASVYFCLIITAIKNIVRT